MEPIRSGTTGERLVRTGILTLMFVAYSGWSFWDGYVAYPKKNVEQLMQNLTPVPDEAPAFHRAVTESAAKSLEGKSEQEVVASFGEPATTAAIKDAVGRTKGKMVHYFGPGGLARVAFEDGRVVSNGVVWQAGSHDDSALLFQIGTGIITGVLGLVMLLQLIRALLTRIELSDDGLKLNSQGGFKFGGSPLIPFEAMEGLRDPDDQFARRKSDYLELDYTLANGNAGVVRINNYVHAAFRDVVNEICKRKGFDNPLESRQESNQAIEGEPDAIHSDE